ncbi:MAG: ABC transporter substrate-binding protein, partial [Desulfobacterales bacterium]|nr:ABC transporter substrate-binding protein [Desulfobacterales bacterium]
MNKPFILALLILSVAACSDGRPDHQKSRILRYDIPAPVGSLIPWETMGSGANHIHPFLFSCLCVPDENGDLKPDLAVSWNYDPSEFIWTIEIRKDARFHDGAPVAAQDVKFSIQSFCVNGIRNYSGNSIKTIEIVSPTRICIKLVAGDPDFINKIWDTGIVPER